MIKRIEINEKLNSIYQTLIVIDLDTQIVTRFLNAELTEKKETNIKKEEMEAFLKNYILYWKENIDSDYIMDGNFVKLNFYFENEEIEYKFSNEYPYNYSEFIKHIKQMVNIYE